MTAGNDFNDVIPPEPELFSALLVPHRSLSRKGFAVLMAVISVLNFTAGMIFLFKGAWPVLAFFLLDVLAIYWAFKINFRDAKATEEISITTSELRVRKTDYRGDATEWVFNPLWVRLDQTVHQEYGIERLCLVSRGHSLAIAQFLGPDEKSSFASALTTALQAAKRGPVYNPLT